MEPEEAGHPESQDFVVGRVHSQSCCEQGYPWRLRHHIASMPGSLADVYNFVTYISLEDGISFEIVWEENLAKLWLYVWKARQLEAHWAGKV